MSESEEHPILLNIATTIADGHPVDWAGIRENHPGMEQDLDCLRLLERIAARVAGQSGAGP